jgi:tRNA (guanine-N7-)-methyltransferase
MTSQPNEQLFYGRRKGRLLRTTKSQLMATLLPQLEISLADNTIFQPQQFFGEQADRFNAYWLEIGFGGGEHLAGWAINNPEIGIIGCEAFVNGVASLLEHIDHNQLTNIRIYPKPVQNLLKSLLSHSIERIFVMFPDPWPKARHQKRRLVNPGFLKEVSRLLVPGGLLHLASDDQSYIEGALETLIQTPDLELVSHKHHHPEDWPATRYEQKALAEGKICHYLVMKSST